VAVIGAAISGVSGWVASSPASFTTATGDGSEPWSIGLLDTGLGTGAAASGAPGIGIDVTTDDDVADLTTGPRAGLDAAAVVEGATGLASGALGLSSAAVAPGAPGSEVPASVASMKTIVARGTHEGP